MKRRPVLVFDLTSGADVEQHPVVRFRIVAFEGGEPPDFLPEWEEVERMELEVSWGNGNGPKFSIHPGAVLLGSRPAAGAIHGFLERYKTTDRYGVHITLAWLSPGRFTQLQALFRMFGKRFPWRLTKVQLPAGVVEQVKL